jgi:hypothetical protein
MVEKRYEIVDELTELKQIRSPLFSTNNEEEALAKLMELRTKFKDGPTRPVLVDNRKNGNIIAS